MHHSLGSCNANNRHRRCFYCVKINPKVIRSSCGQKLVAPAPSGPQACPLWPLPTPPIWILAAPPPTPHVCESPAGASWSWNLCWAWPHYRLHFAYDMNPIVNQHGKHTHTHTLLPCFKDKHVFPLIYRIQCHAAPTPETLTTQMHT